MWRLEHTEALWWLGLIPVMLLCIRYLKNKRDQKLQKIGQIKKVTALMESSSFNLKIFKRSLFVLSVALLLLALSNPQAGKQEESVSQRSSNVVIALDLSNSMLAEDIAPNRLERSKKFLTHLVQKLSGDKVAFIVFAGKAYIQMPFTTDYAAFNMQLQAIHTDMIPYQGTNLRDAVTLAESMQVRDKSEEKILILLSDGEDHDKKAVSAAKQAATHNMTIFTVGIGTPEGAPIPDDSRYKTDVSGNIVQSKLNENALREIAEAGGGQYFNIIHEKKALREILRNVKWAKSTTAEERTYTSYKSYYQWLLFPAIVLLMAELAGIPIFNFRKKQPALILIPLILITGSCQQRVHEISDFNPENVQRYFTALQTDSSAVNFYNLGASYLKLNQPDSAYIMFNQTLEYLPDSTISAQTHFNLGCIYFNQKNYQEAAEAFKEALKFQPGNYRAQHNLSLALAHIFPQEDSPQKDNPDQDGKDENSDDNQKEEQSESDKKDEGKSDEQKESGQDSENEQEQPSENKPENSSKQESETDSRLTPLELQKLYQSLDQQEKVIQKRIMTQQEKDKNQPYIEKDW